MTEDTQRIVVVRHGETEWSRTGRHTGRTDVPLTDGGRHDAQRVGQWLGTETFDRVLTSPLQRAADTCALAGFGEVAEVDPTLVEWDYGEYEGRRSEEILAEQPDWQIWTHGAAEGETVERMQGRVTEVCERLLDLDGRTLVFAHGHFLRALAAAWIELPVTEGRRLLLDTGATGELGWYHRRRALANWNVRPAP
jgi:broad specificity phosphatase PhoE